MYRKNKNQSHITGKKTQVNEQASSRGCAPALCPELSRIGPWTPEDPDQYKELNMDAWMD